MHWYVYELIHIFAILLINDFVTIFYWPIILIIRYAVKIAYQTQNKGVDKSSIWKLCYQHITLHLYDSITSRMLHHSVAASV